MGANRRQQHGNGSRVRVFILLYFILYILVRSENMEVFDCLINIYINWKVTTI